jgi:hypothetical protein
MHDANRSIVVDGEPFTADTPSRRDKPNPRRS